MNVSYETFQARHFTKPLFQVHCPCVAGDMQITSQEELNTGTEHVAVKVLPPWLPLE